MTALFPLLAVAAVGVVILASLHWIAGRWLGRPSAVGDEIDYLRRGGWPDPHRPGLYLRVPAMAFLSRHANRISDDPDLVLRRIMMVLVSSTLVGIAGLATGMHGWAVGMAVLAVLLLQPELLVLSRHIWPEGLLVALHAAIAAALIAGGGEIFHSQLLGCLAGLAFLVRFEQVILVPVLAAAGYWQESIGTADMLFLVLPVAVIWLVLSMRNARHYGIALPDTTWHFNLQIAREEAARYLPQQPRRISRIVSDVVRRNPNELTAEYWRGQRIWQWPAGILKMPQRLWALAGPDSFVRQNLFARNGRAYQIPLPRWADLWLQWAFPLLFSFSFVHAVQIGELPVWMWPTLAFMVATAATFARTRYRLPVIPVLVFWAVPSIHQWLPVTTPAAFLLWLAAGLLLTWLLVRCPSQLER